MLGSEEYGDLAMLATKGPLGGALKDEQEAIRLMKWEGHKRGCVGPVCVK